MPATPSPADRPSSLPALPPLSAIVAATDLTEASAAALRLGAQLAVACGSRLVIAHTVEPLIDDFDLLRDDLATEVMADANAAITRVVEQLPEPQRAMVMDVEVRKGKPVTEMIRLAAERDADLVITGTHGRAGFDRFLIGSTAGKLVRKAPCSVLVVRPELRGTFEHPAVAIDFSEHSARAVLRGIELCRLFGMDRLPLLHVYEVPTRFLRSGITRAEAAERVRERVQELADAFLKRFEGRHDDVTLELTLQAGRATDAITEYVETTGADLLLMGTHGRSDAAQILLGSVTERVLQATPVSVWAERAGNTVGFLDALKDLLG